MRKYSILPALTAALAVNMLTPTLGLAAPKKPYAALVISAYNAATSKNGKTYYPIKRRSRLYSGDIVRTTDNGSAKIKFRDGFLLNMRTNSMVDIKNYRYSQKRNIGKLNLKIGSDANILFVSGKMPKKNVRLKTFVGVVGIRGTSGDILSSGFIHNGKPDANITVSTISGRITLNIKGIITTIPAGFAVGFSSNVPPQTVRVDSNANKMLKNESKMLNEMGKQLQIDIKGFMGGADMSSMMEGFSFGGGDFSMDMANSPFGMSGSTPTASFFSALDSMLGGFFDEEEDIEGLPGGFAP